MFELKMNDNEREFLYKTCIRAKIHKTKELIRFNESSVDKEINCINALLDKLEGKN